MILAVLRRTDTEPNEVSNRDHADDLSALGDGKVADAPVHHETRRVADLPVRLRTHGRGSHALLRRHALRIAPVGNDPENVALGDDPDESRSLAHERGSDFGGDHPPSQLGRNYVPGDRDDLDGHDVGQRHSDTHLLIGRFQPTPD